MRSEVRHLLELGRMPGSKASISHVEQWQGALEKISAPLSDDEAVALVGLFPNDEDDCFGLAWTLVHLIESAKGWPIAECLTDETNPWVMRLRKSLSI